VKVGWEKQGRKFASLVIEDFEKTNFFESVADKTIKMVLRGKYAEI
jgi:hypothetical protein